MCLCSLHCRISLLHTNRALETSKMYWSKGIVAVEWVPNRMYEFIFYVTYVCALIVSLMQCNVFGFQSFRMPVERLNYSWRCDKFSAASGQRACRSEGYESKSKQHRNIFLPSFSPTHSAILSRSLSSMIAFIFHILLCSLIRIGFPYCIQLGSSYGGVWVSRSTSRSGLSSWIAKSFLSFRTFFVLWHTHTLRMLLKARTSLVSKSCGFMHFLDTTYHNSRTNSNTTSTISVWYNVAETNT